MGLPHHIPRRTIRPQALKDEREGSKTDCLTSTKRKVGLSRTYFLGDPHLLKGGERRQDGTSDPDGVFSLRWSDNFNFHC
jgi:hypothetical protein